MAKTKKAADAPLTVEFARTGNPWIDAGIVGLYRILNRLPAYVDEVAEPADDESRPAFPDVKADSLLADRLVLTGPADQVQACLDLGLRPARRHVLQRVEQEAAGGSGRLQLLLRLRLRPVRPLPQEEGGRGGVAAFRQGGPTLGCAGRLGGRGRRQEGARPVATVSRPPSIPARRIPRPGEGQTRPARGPADRRAESGQAQGRDPFRVGRREGHLLPRGRPRIGPGRGQGDRLPPAGREPIVHQRERQSWPRLGWKTDLVGKFVPAVAFFYLQGDDLHLFFPQSNDLRRVERVGRRPPADGRPGAEPLPELQFRPQARRLLLEAIGGGPGVPPPRVRRS